MPRKRPITNDDLARMIKQGFDHTASKDDVTAIRGELKSVTRKLDENAAVLASVHETVKEHTQELREIKGLSTNNLFNFPPEADQPWADISSSRHLRLKKSSPELGSASDFIETHLAQI